MTPKKLTRKKVIRGDDNLIKEVIEEVFYIHPETGVEVPDPTLTKADGGQDGGWTPSTDYGGAVPRSPKQREPSPHSLDHDPQRPSPFERNEPTIGTGPDARHLPAIRQSPLVGAPGGVSMDNPDTFVIPRAHNVEYGPSTRAVVMVEDGKAVVTHLFHGADDDEAAAMEKAHRHYDESLDNAMRGKETDGVDISAVRVDVPGETMTTVYKVFVQPNGTTRLVKDYVGTTGGVSTFGGGGASQYGGYGGGPADGDSAGLHDRADGRWRDKQGYNIYEALFMKDALFSPVTKALGVALREPSEIQTLIFDKDKFTAASARAWAKQHGFKADKVDETDENFRLRQEEPSKYDRMRTIELTDGVKAVIGMQKSVMKRLDNSTPPPWDRRDHHPADTGSPDERVPLFWPDAGDPPTGPLNEDRWGKVSRHMGPDDQSQAFHTSDVDEKESRRAARADRTAQNPSALLLSADRPIYGPLRNRRSPTKKALIL